MASDRELLEVAAKVAGIRHIEYNNDYDGSLGLQCCDAIGRHTHSWNPLNDDGDALRLAVALRMVVTVGRHNVEARRWSGGDTDQPLLCHVVSQGSDPNAATRRAIVKTAAAMNTNNEETAP